MQGGAIGGRKTHKVRVDGTEKARRVAPTKQYEPSIHNNNNNNNNNY